MIVNPQIQNSDAKGESGDFIQTNNKNREMGKNQQRYPVYADTGSAWTPRAREQSTLCS